MKKFNSILIPLVTFVLFFSCSTKNQENESRIDSLPYYDEATFTPIWEKPNTNGVKGLHKVPAFSLTNQDGQEVTENTFKDKIYITDFFFTSCAGICPQMTKNMAILQEVFKDADDILLLSHSVTPVKDSVSVLKSYAKAHGVISGKWHLVTGSQKEIYQLGRKSYFVEENLGFDKSDEAFLHTENFVLVDADKHIRGIYNGLNIVSIEQLIADVKTLRKEQAIIANQLLSQ